MAQGDSVYDIIDAADHNIMRTNLSTSASIETGKKRNLVSKIRKHFTVLHFDAGFMPNMISNEPPPILLSADRLFRCRFNASKSVRRQSAGNKPVLIRARCLSPPASSTVAGSYWTTNPVWVCFCSPLEPHPARSGAGAEGESTSTPSLTDTSLFLSCFHSQHARDMRLQNAQDR